MALTSTQVDVQLKEVGEVIVRTQAERDRAISRLQAAYDQLVVLNTTYSDLISTINGYTEPLGELEATVTARFNAYASEKTALQTALGTDNTNFANNPYPAP